MCQLYNILSLLICTNKYNNPEYIVTLNEMSSSIWVLINRPTDWPTTIDHGRLCSITIDYARSRFSVRVRFRLRIRVRVRTRVTFRIRVRVRIMVRVRVRVRVRGSLIKNQWCSTMVDLSQPRSTVVILLSITSNWSIGRSRSTLVDWLTDHDQPLVINHGQLYGRWCLIDWLALSC